MIGGETVVGRDDNIGIDALNHSFIHFYSNRSLKWDEEMGIIIAVNKW